MSPDRIDKDQQAADRGTEPSRFGTVAKRYAKATMELAEEAGIAPQVDSELEVLARLLRSSAELRHVFKHPQLSAERKEAVLAGVLQDMALSRLTHRVIGLLLRANRFLLLPEIALAFQSLLDERINRARATVTTASPLEADVLEQLRRRLAKMTGNQMEIQTRVDPSLLGGFRAQIGSLVYDASLRSRLQSLREELASPVSVRNGARR